ncbi:hypothetical protein CSA37_01455 [Candidatus Fermentibacteria bacterium]|nr:MAG: hypothetical protein CSA37_01455 [Candidatus Fermentibacteria bacterium]
MSETAFIFETTPEFDKDLKKYSRKHRSLPEDIENLKTAMKVAHFTDGISSMGFFPVSHPEIPEGFFIAKKFACKSLKGSGSRSGYRVVYHLQGEVFKICLLELYRKNEKAVEDFQRLKDCKFTKENC